MIAIVTGASSGIGRSIYIGLKDSGMFETVLGGSRRGPDIFVDLSKAIPEGVLPKSDIGLLVNAAGIMPFEETPYVFDVNFWGAYNMIQSVYKGMIDGSCIINIASISGMIAEPELPVYAASKAAVLSLTKSLARLYAPRVRVNAISPGFYNTNLVEGPTPPELLEKVPMKYESNPEELYPIVTMIYQTKYMTGANIVVDGGLIC